MPKLTIVFPSSYFSIHKVDEVLMAEYDAALETGMFDIVLFSYDKWLNEGKLVLDRTPDELVRGVYRGCMIKPEVYADFYERLADKNISLVTSPKEYELFHIFPNIYPCFGKDTAEMMVFPDGKIDLCKVRERFERFMVKDYVKSVKGTDFPTYFYNSVSNEEFETQMQKFYRYRGGLYTGGVCVKEYLDLRKYEDNTNEYRVFYINNEPVTISRNSCQGIYTPMPPKELIDKYKDLQSPFYTMDYAELSDGTWKIIEAGDGQVSGLSDRQDYTAFFRALSLSLEEKR